MRAAIVFLLAMLSAVATPAAAEWTFIVENGSGDQFFIDLATLKKGARPRAWVLTNSSTSTKYGDLSSKMLYEADCREERIRVLAGRFYTEPMGAGPPSTSGDQPQEWGYVTPNSAEERIAHILCRGNR
jgi:hypothetical protein